MSLSHAEARCDHLVVHPVLILKPREVGGFPTTNQLPAEAAEGSSVWEGGGKSVKLIDTHKLVHRQSQSNRHPQACT